MEIPQLTRFPCLFVPEKSHEKPNGDFRSYLWKISVRYVKRKERKSISPMFPETSKSLFQSHAFIQFSSSSLNVFQRTTDLTTCLCLLLQLCLLCYAMLKNVLNISQLVFMLTASVHCKWYKEVRWWVRKLSSGGISLSNCDCWESNLAILLTLWHDWNWVDYLSSELHRKKTQQRSYSLICKWMESGSMLKRTCWVVGKRRKKPFHVRST